MALSSSESDLSSDWAVISKHEEDLNKSDEDNHSPASQESTARLIESDAMPQGSKAVEIIQELPASNDSSSDIDIIDETFDDNPPGFVHPPPALSLTTSIASSIETNASALDSSVTDMSENDVKENSECITTDPILDETPEVDNSPSAETAPGLGKWIFDFIISLVNGRPEEHLSAKWAIYMALSGLIIIFLHCNVAVDLENNKIMYQMRELVKELQFESRDLKSQVMSEIQNEKVFAIFATQVKELKKENLKLTQTLQDVILELQKQSAFHEKEMERKQLESHNLYNTEINKLKEQVNILQFDNEELQKQLVRMRYASYSSESQNDKNEVPDENGRKEDLEKNGESSPEVLTDEVRELKKDLHEEVLKLKKWNELVELLVINLQKSSEKKEEITEKIISSDSKDHHWSWKDFKKSLKGTFNDFPEMFTKYMNYNRRRVEGAFKSVHHYFKVAQEETQKMLNSNAFDLKKESIRNSDIWNSMEALGEKWSELGDKWSEFFKMNNEDKKSTQQKNHDTSDFSNTYFGSSDNAEKEKVNFGKYKHQGKHEDKIQMPAFGQEEYHPKKPDQFKKHEDSNWYLKKSNEGKFHGNDDADSNSWMFERAAYRAEVRQNDEDLPINWYLRKSNEKNDFYQTSEKAYMDEGSKVENLKHENRGKQKFNGKNKL